MSDHRISRRSILSASAALTSTGALWLPLKGLPREFQKTEAKNIIFCAVDGMAMSVLTMAHHLNQLRGGKGSYWAWLLDQDFVVNGLQDTPSLSSLVTDSAAAASAWGCGRRIWNAQINEFPDGTKLRTLYDLMQAKGMRTGLVTTTRITHATPSGFAIQIDHRDKENEIAVQHLQANVDVLMGGGHGISTPPHVRTRETFSASSRIRATESCATAMRCFALRREAPRTLFQFPHSLYGRPQARREARRHSTHAR